MSSSPLQDAPDSALALVTLLDTLAALYPDGEVRIGGRAPVGDPSVVSYAVVPGFADPRLVVPLVPAKAAARSLRRYSAMSSYRDVLARGSAAAATRVSRTVLPDRVAVHGADGDCLLTHLGERLGREVHASLGIGTPRVNRKPVLQLFDERGDVLGFAKIGDSARAIADVTAEGAALRRVATREWHQLVAPTVIDESTWRGMVVLVVSALPAGSDQARRDVKHPPLAAMDELAGAFDGGSEVLARIPWWGRQRAGAELVTDPDRADLLEACLDAIALRAGRRPLQVGAWHGDWTPWNMAVGRGQVRLWDWERFETGVPAGMDRFHYDVNVATSRHGTRHATVAAALPRPTDSTPALLADLYLVAVIVRYLSMADEVGGELVDVRTACLLSVLCSRLGVQP